MRCVRASWSARVGPLLIAAIPFATGACGEDFGTDPPPGPSEETWSRGFGDDASQSVNAVAVDELGAVYVTGAFSGTTDFGGGPVDAAGTSDDLFVAKYDTNGDHLWSRRFGDSGTQSGYGLALGSEGEVIVVGDFSGSIDLGSDFLQATDGSDVFLLVLEPDGEPRFGKAFAGAGRDRPTALVVDGAGNLVIGGYYDGDIAFGGDLLFAAGEDDIFVAKFLPTGEHVWSHRFGDAADDRLYDLSVNSRGDVACTGSLGGGVVDFGGGPLDPVGSDANEDAFVAVFGPDGGHQWSRRFGDEMPQRGRGAAYDAADHLVLTGEFGGTIDFGGDSRTSTGGFDAYLAKLDENGNPIMSNAFGVSQSQYGRCVATGPERAIFLAGVFDGAVTFGGLELQSEGDSDLFVARLEQDGAHLGSASFGDALSQQVSDLAVDAAGHAIIVGNFNGSIDFGFGPHGTADEMDQNSFVAKIDP